MGKYRNTIRYNSVGLFLTDAPDEDTGKTSLRFLNRVQSVDLSVDIQRQDVAQIGSDKFLDRKIVSAPEIQLDFEYFLTDGYEEDAIGLNTYPSPIIYTEEYGVIDKPVEQNGTIHNDVQDNKSVFLVFGEEEFDLTGYANRENAFSGINVIGLGNCYVTNYSASAGVGDFAKAKVSMSASNIEYNCLQEGEQWYQIMDELSAILRQIDQNDEDFVLLENGGRVFLESTLQTELVGGADDPSLDLPNKGSEKEIGIVFEPEFYKSPVSAMGPGAINVKIKNINAGGPILSDKNQANCFQGYAHMQNFEINAPFDRENLQGFESMHLYGRKLKYPQLGTISFSILPSAFENGKISEIFCQDEIYEIEIEFNNECNFSCLPLHAKDTNMKYTISNAKLDGYSLGQSIGSYATFDCNFSFGLSRQEGLFLYGTHQNSRLEPCGPTMLAAPRNMDVSNVSTLGEKDQPDNIGVIP